MKKIVSLKKEYVSVGGSFGGNQNFFKDSKKIFSKGKQMGGCGVVALTDTVSYLNGFKHFTDPEAYRSRFNETAKKILFFPSRFGMTFIKAFWGMRFLSHIQKLHVKCRWVLPVGDPYKKICRMLSEDLPVILCIPKIYGPGKKARMLTFYDPETLKPADRTHGHFVVATGVYINENDIYLEISSWGKRFFIKYSEFRAFVKKHPTGVLGYMLELKRS